MTNTDTETTANIENFVAAAAAENVKQTEIAPETSTAATLPASPGLAAAAETIKQTKDHVTSVTTHMLGVVETAEGRLRDLKDTVLSDAARIKTELDNHMLSAEAVVRHMEGIGQLIDEIMGRRNSVLSPGEGTK